MSKPTYEDARVMLGLIQAGSAFGVNEALGIIWADDFPKSAAEFWEKYPMGSPGFNAVLGAMRYFETIGTLVRNGLFNENLAYDWLAIKPVWERVKPIAEDMRGDTPALWENFEYMAERQRNWTPTRD